MKFFTHAALCASFAILGACAATDSLPYMREQAAQRIASPAWLLEGEVSTELFTFKTFDRIQDHGGIANIYIEGDGDYMSAPALWLTNPTPTQPLSLQLATRDPAENTIYLARPCQYIQTGNCDSQYWRSARFSQDVISAYNAALNKLKIRYNIPGFNLIGYEGGGTIATILAGQRQDVLSIRTVSPFISNKYGQSLSPLGSAAKIRDIPQLHLLGEKESTPTVSGVAKLTSLMPGSSCTQTATIQDITHKDHWIEKWPSIMQIPVNCEQAPNKPLMLREPVAQAAPESAPLMTIKTPTIISRETPVKP